MANGVTREGKELFGKWVASTRLSLKTREQVVEWLQTSNPREYVGDTVTQGQFARWVTSRTGFQVSDAAIGRLERGDYRNAPPLEVLVALTQIEILILPEGRFCTLDDVVSILVGDLNPFTGKRENCTNGN